MSSDEKPKKPRGFAAMDPKVVSEIARKGGKAAHVHGTAHEFTSEEAREAGRRGGYESHRRRIARERGPRDTIPDLSTMAAAHAHIDDDEGARGDVVEVEPAPRRAAK